jgi:hypothetical protein
MRNRLTINFWLNGALSLGFAAATTAPLIAFLITPSPDVLMPENRRPTPAPLRWRIDRFLPQIFDAYFADRFGFRSQLVELHNYVRVMGLGLSTCPNIVIGKNGWMFFDDNDSHADFAGKAPFTSEQMERWRVILEGRRDWLAQRGCQSLFVVVPNKETIYPEFMPDDRGPRGRTRLDQLVAHLQSHSNVAVLDLRPALITAKATEDFVLYRRWDTHWNDRGAFAADRAICDALRPSLPNLGPTLERGQYESKTIPPENEYVRPDLARMLGVGNWLNEPLPYLQPRQPTRAQVVPTTIRPDRYHPPATSVTVFEVPDPSLPRLVVFGDSFVHTLSRFVAEHFQRSVFIAHHWPLDRALVEEERPQVVIFEVCERYLGYVLNVEAECARESQEDRRASK